MADEVYLPVVLVIHPEDLQTVLREAAKGLSIPLPEPASPSVPAAAEPEPPSQGPFRIKIDGGASAEEQGKSVVLQSLEHAHGGITRQIVEDAWTDDDTKAIGLLKSLFSGVSLEALAGAIMEMPTTVVSNRPALWLAEAFKQASASASASPVASPVGSRPSPAVPKRRRGRPKKTAQAAPRSPKPSVPGSCPVCGMIGTHMAGCPGQPMPEADGGAIQSRVGGGRGTAPAQAPVPDVPTPCPAGGNCPLPHRLIFANGVRTAVHVPEDLAAVAAAMGVAPMGVAPPALPRAVESQWALPQPPRRGPGRPRKV